MSWLTPARRGALVDILVRAAIAALAVLIGAEAADAATLPLGGDLPHGALAVAGAALFGSK